MKRWKVVREVYADVWDGDTSEGQCRLKVGTILEGPTNVSDKSTFFLRPYDRKEVSVRHDEGETWAKEVK